VRVLPVQVSLYRLQQVRPAGETVGSLQAKCLVGADLRLQRLDCFQLPGFGQDDPRQLGVDLFAQLVQVIQ
jgi:hypothetical protein